MANVIRALTNDGIESFAVLPSAARTAAPDTLELRNLGRVTGLIVVVDVTASAATPVVNVKIQGVDVFSGKTWDILTSADIAGTGTTVLRVRPGITPVTNVAVADALPPTVRITALHSDADSITYSVSAHLID
jgi:hypothetical protein